MSEGQHASVMRHSIDEGCSSEVISPKFNYSFTTRHETASNVANNLFLSSPFPIQAFEKHAKAQKPIEAAEHRYLLVLKALAGLDSEGVRGEGRCRMSEYGVLCELN